MYEALQTAIGEVGMTCRRADEIWENDHVVQHVALLLCKAAVVVCDLSGRNPNVSTKRVSRIRLIARSSWLRSQQRTSRSMWPQSGTSDTCRTVKVSQSPRRAEAPQGCSAE